MLSVASALFSRLAPAEAISRREAFALAIITILHLAALVVMTATELISDQGNIPLRLGPSEFSLAGIASPSRNCRAALPVNGERAHSSVAVQIRQADDDGEFRRPDDNRSGYIGVSVYDMPRLRWPILCGVVAAVPILTLLWRSILFACVYARPWPEVRCAWPASYLCRLRIRPIFTESFLTGIMFQSSRARGSRRSTNLPRTGCWNRTRRLLTVSRRLPRPVVQVENFHTSFCCTDESSFDITAAPGMKVPSRLSQSF